MWGCNVEVRDNVKRLYQLILSKIMIILKKNTNSFFNQNLKTILELATINFYLIFCTKYNLRNVSQSIDNFPFINMLKIKCEWKG